MAADRASTIVMSVPKLKLEQQLSISMVLFMNEPDLFTPWFTSPDLTAERLWVRCYFSDWQWLADSRDLVKEAEIEFVRCDDMKDLKKHAARRFTEHNTDEYMIVDDCNFIQCHVEVQVSVPGTDVRPFTCKISSLTNETPDFLPYRVKTALYSEYFTKSHITQYAEQDRQLELTIQVTLWKDPFVSMYFYPYLPSPVCSTLFSTTNTLQKMLSKALLPDVQLQLQGGALPAHRAVLAACSPVFRAMFQHDMKESQTGQVDLRDVPLAAMKAALKLLYGGKLSSDDPELWVQLLSLADRYQLTPLKTKCEATLTAWVPKLPAELQLRLLADRHNAPGLRKAIMKNFPLSLRAAKLRADVVRDLIQNHPSVAEEVINILLDV